MNARFPDVPGCYPDARYSKRIGCWYGRHGAQYRPKAIEQADAMACPLARRDDRAFHDPCDPSALLTFATAAGLTHGNRANMVRRPLAGANDLSEPEQSRAFRHMLTNGPWKQYGFP